MKKHISIKEKEYILSIPTIFSSFQNLYEFNRVSILKYIIREICCPNKIDRVIH